MDTAPWRGSLVCRSDRRRGAARGADTLRRTICRPAGAGSRWLGLADGWEIRQAVGNFLRRFLQKNIPLGALGARALLLASPSGGKREARCAHAVAQDRVEGGNRGIRGAPVSHGQRHCPPPRLPPLGGGRAWEHLFWKSPKARTTPWLPYRVRNATVTGSRAAWMAGRRPPAAPMLRAHTRPCASRLGVTRKSNATCEKVLKLSVEREAPSQ